MTEQQPHHKTTDAQNQTARDNSSERNAFEMWFEQSLSDLLHDGLLTDDDLADLSDQKDQQL